MKSQTRGLLVHWYLRISCFLPNFRIEHTPGSTNFALSRAPIQTKEHSDVLRVAEKAKNPLISQVQAQQRQNPDLLSIIEYLENQVLPKNPLETKRVVSLQTKDVPGRKRLVVPKNLQRALLNEYHVHHLQDILKSRNFLEDYWASMKGDGHRNYVSCVVHRDKAIGNDHP